MLQASQFPHHCPWRYSPHPTINVPLSCWLFNTMKFLLSLFPLPSLSPCYKASKIRVLHCIDTGKATKYYSFHSGSQFSTTTVTEQNSKSRKDLNRAKLFSVGLWMLTSCLKIIKRQKLQTSAPFKLTHNIHQYEDQDKIWAWSFNVRFS